MTAVVPVYKWSLPGVALIIIFRLCRVSSIVNFLFRTVPLPTTETEVSVWQIPSEARVSASGNPARDNSMKDGSSS